MDTVYISENAPNPARLIDSLRYLGYNNQSAIADLVDNSWDAGAKTVYIEIEHDKTIAIADDGSGMDLHTLDQALRLGSLTGKDSRTDLGKFGMGLSTASLSLCRRTEVITHKAGEPAFVSIVDIDVIQERNLFVKALGEADGNQRKMYYRYLRRQPGTVVRLTKCDGLQTSKPEVFANQLRKRLGLIYRHILIDGRQIVLNGQKVLPVDPLLLNDGAEVVSDEAYDGLRVKLVLLPDYGQDGARERGVSMTGQGFYVLRNNREIASADWLGLLPRHPDHNRIRAELSFPASMDALMGVNFTKHQVQPHQTVIDMLSREVLPQIRTLVSKIKHARVKVQDSNINHDEASRLIAKKALLLPKFKGMLEKRAKRKPRKSVQQEPKTERERIPKKIQLKPVSLPCRFETLSMTSAGPIYNVEQQAKTLIIQWNVDHPFYSRFVIENKDNPGMISATDFLVYAMASNEMLYMDEDVKGVAENIRSGISSTMRTLLS